MTEVMPVTYEQIQRNDVVEAAWSIIGDLESYIETLPESVQFGPTYYVSTSNGDNLRIHTIELKGWVLYTDKATPYKTILFVAEVPSGQVVGFRDTELRRVAPTSSPPAVGAVGEIVTLVRRYGVATSVELAHFDFLQREANREQCQVTYAVSNRNLKRMWEARDDTRIPPEEKTELLVELAQEQDRWQALYGPQGKLGFNYKGQRTFYPEKGTGDTGIVLAEVNLRRIESKWLGRTLVTAEPEMVREVGDPHAFHLQKLELLKQDLFPRLKAAISA